MSFTRLRFHIVFATKMRTPWIDREIEEFVYPIIRRSARLNDGQVVEIGGVEDHVHIICGVRPVITLSDFIERIKSESAGAIRRNFRRRRAFKWQVGYGAFTLSALDYAKAVDYVVNQKEHHRRDKLWKAFEKMDEGVDDEQTPSGARRAS